MKEHYLQNQPAAGNNIQCKIPRYRADFLHQVDLIEELALGYSIGNFQPETPSLFTKGSLSGQTVLTEKARDALSACGFVEIQNHVLTSDALMDRCFVKDFIRIQNPVSRDYSILRSELLPLLLETASKNTHHSYPQKIFEVGETAVFEKSLKTNLNASALILSGKASLSEIASYLSVFSKAIGIEFKLEKTDSRKFLKNRGLSIKINGKEKGSIGEINPEILVDLGIEMPACGFELELSELHQTRTA